MYGRSVFIPLAFCSLIAITGCQDRDAGNQPVTDSAAGAVIVTAEKCSITDTVLDAMSADALFQQPYVDMDEWRDEPVRHRYVHGGFEGTETRFSLYMPPEEHYDGRFFQYITPVPMNEHLSQGATGEEDKIGFSIGSGAYFIETNGGGMKTMMEDSTIAAYRANAAVAQYSRVIAMEMYGCERPYGYAFGGSGGGYRTIGGMENTEGVWDGAVPYVIGSPMAIPNVFTVRMYALRILKDKLPAIADAVDAGSDIEVTELLTEEENNAFLEVTKMGFPRQAWYVHDKLDLHGYASLFPGLVAADPSYFSEDFWTKSGYQGHNPPQSLLDAIVEHPTHIKKLIFAENAEQSGLRKSFLGEESQGLADDAWKAMIQSNAPDAPVALQLDSVPGRDLLGADLRISSGDAAGGGLLITRFANDFVLVGSSSGDALSKLQAGDEVEINNRNYLASQTYHRHQVPEDGYPVYDQYRDGEGNPVYPQRPFLLAPTMVKGAAGSVPSGNFKGKIIALASLHDTEAYPWQGDWYLQAAREHFGNDANNHIRLWYTDRAAHGDISDVTMAGYYGGQSISTQVVSYLGVLQQALRDVSAWVEEGIAPPATSAYRVVDGQVQLPENSADHRGIQPVISLLANGGDRAEVAVGEPVELSATIVVPSGTGELVQAEWDFDGRGDYPLNADLAAQDTGAFTVSASHSYDAPGTYFVTLRATSQRDGDATTPYTLIRNLSRVRIVVE